MNVNFTNNEGIRDEAIVSISVPAGWNISWGNQESPSLERLYEMSPGELAWVGYSIEAPTVSGGLPLSESLHQFSMRVQSLDNASSDWYNFSLRYGFFDGASIVEGGGVSSIEPGSTDIFEIMLRNEGNSWRELKLEIIPLDSASQPVGKYDLYSKMKKNVRGYFFYKNFNYLYKLYLLYIKHNIFFPKKVILCLEKIYLFLNFSSQLNKAF